MSNQAKFNKLWMILLFTLVFLGEFGFGIYLSYYREFVYYDAVSRVANSFYVLFSRDPHLGAIGFVWNPLPSLLEIPPLLLWPIIPEIAAAGLAANLITALCAAGTAVMIFRFSNRRTGSTIISICLTLGFALNPFIFIYGANGMSEAMFSFCIVWLVIALLKWMEENQSLHTISMGFALAIAFWIRYESIALGIGMALSIIVIGLDRRYRQSLTNSQVLPSDWSPTKIESTLIVTLTPAFFSGIAWLGLNYFIMGDPLFFFRSGYSNLAFSGNLTDEFTELISTPTGVLWLVLRKSAYFSIPLIVILLIRIMNGRWRRWDLLVLVLLTASIPAMQYVLLLKGSSFGWLRFFVYTYVIAVAWIPYELSQLRKTRYYRMSAAAMCISVILSAFVVFDMNNNKLSPDEYEIFHIDESGTHHDLTLAKEVSRYTDQLIRDVANENSGEKPLILTDSYSAYSVLLNSSYPRQWVITNDRDFELFLENPHENKVDYFLVSRKIGSVLQIIHETYPDMYEGGLPWAELVQDFDGDWRLFRIIDSVINE